MSGSSSQDPKFLLQQIVNDYGLELSEISRLETDRIVQIVEDINFKLDRVIGALEKTEKAEFSGLVEARDVLNLYTSVLTGRRDEIDKKIHELKKGSAAAKIYKKKDDESGPRVLDIK